MPLFKSRSRKQLEELQVALTETRTELSAIKNETVTLNDVERLQDLFSVPTSAAGMRVTTETAMRVSAVYACVRLIAGAIATLPLQIYKRTVDSRESDATHPLYSMLHSQPNPIVSAVVYWETVVSHILLGGNHYSLIGRNRAGNALDLTPLQPSRVAVDKANGRLHYAVCFDDGTYAVYDQDDVLHIPGIGWDGKKGLSPIGYAGQNTVGAAMAADEYAARFFANDATPRGYLAFEKKLSPDQAELIRNYWHNRYQGVAKSHLPGIITEGGEFKEISMSAEDGQILETRRFQVSDIARMFGVPPFMIGETDKSTSWGTGIEQQGIGFVTYTLRPHLRRIEQELERKLFGSGTHYAEFNTAGLLRGDTKGRFDAYKLAIGGSQVPGWMTINEVRRLENKPPLDGGDVLYQPVPGDVYERIVTTAD